MPPNLPGFYFDTEKNRYFKIQANHVAPEGSKYSQQVVKAEKSIKRAKLQEESASRSKAATTVARAKALQHPQLALGLERRLGDLRTGLRASIGQHYAASLRHNHVLTADSDAPDYAHPSTESGQFSIDHNTGTLFGDFVLPQSTRDTQQRQLRRYMIALHRSISTDTDLHPSDDSAVREQWLSLPRQHIMHALYPWRYHDTIAQTARVDHIASVGAGLVVWTQGCHPNQNPQETRIHVGACSHGPFSDRQDLTHEMALYAKIQDVAVLPSTASGYPSLMVTLATRDALWLLDTSTLRYPMTKYPLHQSDGTNDLMKIRFKDHNILMGGTRSGKMLLCDIREPPSTTTGRSSMTRIQHSSAVMSLQALPDGNTILLAGSDSTRAYDLRHTPQPSLKCHLPRANSYRQSPSVMTFAIPHNRQQSQYGLAWAYDPELNLMISASTDNVKDHRVGIWNCSTGRMVKRPLNDHIFDAPVTCADVVRLRDGPKSILLNYGGKIIEWTAQGIGEYDD